MNEAIQVTQKRFGYFPRTFMWHGREYNVVAVVRCWTTGSRRNGGRMQRHYFTVKCADQQFTLYHEISLNTWSIER